LGHGSRHEGFAQSLLYEPLDRFERGQLDDEVEERPPRPQRSWGQPFAKHMVALGTLAATGLLPEASFLAANRESPSRNAALVEVNLEAFRRGGRWVSGRASLTPG